MGNYAAAHAGSGDWGRGVAGEFGDDDGTGGKDDVGVTPDVIPEEGEQDLAGVEHHGASGVGGGDEDG